MSMVHADPDATFSFGNDITITIVGPSNPIDLQDTSDCILGVIGSSAWGPVDGYFTGDPRSCDTFDRWFQALYGVPLSLSQHITATRYARRRAAAKRARKARKVTRRARS